MSDVIVEKARHFQFPCGAHTRVSLLKNQEASGARHPSACGGRDKQAVPSEFITAPEGRRMSVYPIIPA
ncbi:MAG: hypothetical protein ABIC40_01515, partial [bacterium]